MAEAFSVLCATNQLYGGTGNNQQKLAYGRWVDYGPDFPPWLAGAFGDGATVEGVYMTEPGMYLVMGLVLAKTNIVRAAGDPPLNVTLHLGLDFEVGGGGTA